MLINLHMLFNRSKRIATLELQHSYAGQFLVLAADCGRVPALLIHL